MLQKIARFMKNYGLALGVLALAGLFIADLFWLPPAVFSSENVQVAAPVSVPKLSEIKGPSIGGEAASTDCPSNATTCGLPGPVETCTTLPANGWIALLSAYLFLLIFNLGYPFSKSAKVQWFWEMLYTLLAIYAWFALDQCFVNVWYPLYVLTLGILIYLFYLYFFWEKQKTDQQKPEGM